MQLPAGTRLIPLDTDARLEEVLRLDGWAFPSEVSVSDLLAVETPVPWGRTWAVETADGSLGAMYATYTLSQFPVPGAITAGAWLTWVGVHPALRRQGVLRALIAHHFADCRARGEAISGLNAAEAGIYGRFGYGMATPQVSLTIPRGAALRDVPGSAALSVELREWDGARDGAEVAALHAGYAQLPPPDSVGPGG